MEVEVCWVPKRGKMQAVKLVSGGFLLEDPSSQRKIVDLTKLIWTMVRDGENPKSKVSL